MSYGSQLLVAGSRGDNRFSSFFPCGVGTVQRIKDRGANKDGEEQGYYIHTDTEKEGLPAANSGKGCSFHGFQIKFSKGNG